MNCALALRMLDAHIDNELDAATATDIAAHIATCAACAEAHDHRAAMRSALRTTALRHAAPPGLRKAILRSVHVSQRPLTPPRMIRWWQAIALGASMAVMGALGGWWIAQPHLLEVLPEYTVAAHVASLSPNGPRIDIASSDRHVVRPWFQGRLEFAPRVRDLSAQGFELVGARVDRLADRQAVAVVYKVRSHFISVYSWPSVEYRADVERTYRAKVARNATIRGFNVMTWSDDDMSYAAVSDTEGAELQRFAAAYRAP